MQREKREKSSRNLGGGKKRKNLTGKIYMDEYNIYFCILYVKILYSFSLESEMFEWMEKIYQ
jgi:hypothetical protein